MPGDRAVLPAEKIEDWRALANMPVMVPSGKRQSDPVPPGEFGSETPIPTAEGDKSSVKRNKIGRW